MSDIPAAASDRAAGLILVRAPQPKVVRWAAKGLVTVSVGPLQGWTAVSLEESSAVSAAPYDVGVEVLSARPIPARMRPAIGFFVLSSRGVLTIQLRGLRPAQRWYVWESGRGLVHTPDLPQGNLQHLVEAAEPAAGVRLDDLGAVLRRRDGRVIDWLADLARALHLPGEQVLRGAPVPHARLVEPKPRAIAAFDALVADARADSAGRSDAEVSTSDGTVS